MTSALVITAPGIGAPPLSDELQAAGIHVLGACECDKLVQQALRCAPDVVVCWEPQPAEGGLFSALELLSRTQPMPVLVFTADASVEGAQRALELGVAGWVVHGYAPTRLRPLLQLTRTRFEHEQRLRSERDEAHQRLEERKLVDRAKGILMRSHGLSEDEAFRRLRGAAMQGKLRVGRLSQQLIDAARDAEALNRSGQLRMLSQRLLRLAAQACEAPEARALRTARDEALRRVDDILEWLRTMPGTDAGSAWRPLLEHTALAYAALRRALPARPTAAALALADPPADAMLAAAEELLAVMEAASGRRALQIINLCGRQRMRVQRVAKQALLAHLLADAARRESLPVLLDEFEAAIHELEQAPLSSPEIQAALADSRDQWLRLLRGLHGLDKPEGRQTLVQASDALLDLFDRLTVAYERSLQVIMA